MIETIEENETATQVEFLDWDESFGLFCSINKDIEFSKINLIDFVNYIKNNKQVIQTQFDIQMRRDFEKKPITQLNVFLEFMGLGVVKSKTVVSNKEKSYFYKLDEKRLKHISSIVEDRNKEINEKSRFYSENN